MQSSSALTMLTMPMPLMTLKCALDRARPDVLARNAWHADPPTSTYSARCWCPLPPPTFPPLYSASLTVTLDKLIATRAHCSHFLLHFRVKKNNIKCLYSNAKIKTQAQFPRSPCEIELRQLVVLETK